MRPVKSPHVRTKMVRTGARIDAGRAMALEVRAWMESHEDDFRAMHGFVRNLRENGVRGRVRDHVALFCADMRIQVGDGPTAFKNGLWAGIERYMVLIDPPLGEYPIRMMDSVIDCYGLLPVSWLPEIGGRHDD